MEFQPCYLAKKKTFGGSKARPTIPPPKKEPPPPPFFFAQNKKIFLNIPFLSPKTPFWCDCCKSCNEKFTLQLDTYTPNY